MKIWLSVLVDSNDPSLDFSGSVIEKDDLEGTTVYDIDLQASYNGIEIDDMDWEKAEEHLLDLVTEGAIEAGRPIPSKVTL